MKRNKLYNFLKFNDSLKITNKNPESTRNNKFMSNLSISKTKKFHSSERSKTFYNESKSTSFRTGHSYIAEKTTSQLNNSTYTLYKDCLKETDRLGNEMSKIFIFLLFYYLAKEVIDKIRFVENLEKNIANLKKSIIKNQNDQRNIDNSCKNDIVFYIF